jgi:hypothetical protein
VETRGQEARWSFANISQGSPPPAKHGCACAPSNTKYNQKANCKIPAITTSGGQGCALGKAHTGLMRASSELASSMTRAVLEAELCAASRSWRYATHPKALNGSPCSQQTGTRNVRPDGSKGRAHGQSTHVADYGAAPVTHTHTHLHTLDTGHLRTSCNKACMQTIQNKKIPSLYASRLRSCCSLETTLTVAQSVLSSALNSARAGPVTSHTMFRKTFARNKPEFNHVTNRSGLNAIT